MFRLRILVVTAGMAAATLCLCAPPAPAAKPPHRPAMATSVPYLGFVVGDYQTSTLERAQTTMQDVARLHGNTVRLVVTYKDPAAIDPAALAVSQADQDDVCYAVQAGQAAKLTALAINLQIKRWLWPKYNDPDTVSALARYNAAQKALIDKVAQCLAPPPANPLQIILMVGNEPNSPDFCGYQDPQQTKATPEAVRHKMCAFEAAQLYRSASDFIRQYNQKVNAELGYNLPILVANLGLSSHSDPIGFAKLFCGAVRKLGYTGVWMGDLVGFHPYSLAGVSNSASGYLSGYTTGEKVYSILLAPNCLGPQPKKCYTEAGDESVIPPGTSGYSGYQWPSVLTLSPGQIVTATRLELQTTLNNGEACYWHFLMKDEPDLEGWQSGVEDPSGAPKSYYNDFGHAYADFAPPSTSTAQP